MYWSFPRRRYTVDFSQMIISWSLWVYGVHCCLLRMWLLWFLGGGRGLKGGAAISAETWPHYHTDLFTWPLDWTSCCLLLLNVLQSKVGCRHGHEHPERCLEDSTMAPGSRETLAAIWFCQRSLCMLREWILIQRLCLFWFKYEIKNLTYFKDIIFKCVLFYENIWLCHALIFLQRVDKVWGFYNRPVMQWGDMLFWCYCCHMFNSQDTAEYNCSRYCWMLIGAKSWLVHRRTFCTEDESTDKG